MTIELNDNQSKIWNALNLTDNKFVRVVGGGSAGGGKSMLISLWLDYNARKYPGTRYYMARETLKDIKESVLLTYFDVTKWTGASYKYREDKSKIVYGNGSEIYLLEVFAYPSDPNFDSFGSREYTAGAIEEGITVTKRAADILISRTRYKHDVYDLFPKQFITCNPGDGWIKDDIVMPQLETGKAKRESDIFIPITLHDNPNAKFADAYTKTLEENLSQFDRERLLGGNWNARQKTGAEYLKNFEADRHANFYHIYNPYLPVHLSFDENVNPHITCQIWQIETINEVRHCRLIHEICPKPPRNTRSNVCKEVIDFLGGHNTGLFIYGDATSQKGETGKEYGENFFTEIAEGLRQYNPIMRVPTKNPPVVSRGGFLNLIFEREYRNIAIEVNRSCKVAINDFSNALEDAEGGISKKRVTDPQTGVSYEKYGHACDALAYFICEAFMNDFLYYQSGGYNPSYEVGNDRDYRFER